MRFHRMRYVEVITAARTESDYDANLICAATKSCSARKLFVFEATVLSVDAQVSIHGNIKCIKF